MNLCHAYLKETLLPTETSGQVRFVRMYSCTFVRNALIIDKNFLNGIISSRFSNQFKIMFSLKTNEPPHYLMIKKQNEQCHAEKEKVSFPDYL